MTSTIPELSIQERNKQLPVCQEVAKSKKSQIIPEIIE